MGLVKTGSLFGHGSIIKQCSEGELQKATAPSQQAQIQSSSLSKSSEPPCWFSSTSQSWLTSREKNKQMLLFLIQHCDKAGQQESVFQLGFCHVFLCTSAPGLTHWDGRSEKKCTKRLKCHLSCAAAAAKWTHREIFNSCGPVFIEILQFTYLSGF